MKWLMKWCWFSDSLIPNDISCHFFRNKAALLEKTSTASRGYGGHTKRSPQKDHVIEGPWYLNMFDNFLNKTCWEFLLVWFSRVSRLKCRSWESSLKFIEVLGEFHHWCTDEFLNFASHFFTGTWGAVVNLWVNGYCKSQAGKGSSSFTNQLKK